jgi:hypothetical protein
VGNIWKVGAPSIDIRSPDLYSPDLPVWINWYQETYAPDNPLFIPETDGNTGTYHVFYALGQHDAMGFSPFAIDELGLSPPSVTATEAANLPLARSYAILAQLAPLILKNQGTGKMAGVVVGADELPQKISLGDYVLSVSYARNRRPPAPTPAKPTTGAPAVPAPTPQPAPVALEATQLPDRAGALFISMGPDEFLVAGSGPVNVAFSPNTPGAPIAGIVSIDEGAYVNGRWVPGRRLNGDENGQGTFLRLGGGTSRNGSVQRVKLYRYR